jgi:hypothetical protein
MNVVHSVMYLDEPLNGANPFVVLTVADPETGVWTQRMYPLTTLEAKDPQLAASIRDAVVRAKPVLEQLVSEEG